MGMVLFAEYIDAIAVADIDTTPTLGTLTVTTAAGSDSSHTTISSVTPAKEAAGNVYKYKCQTGEASVTYGQNVKYWATWDGKATTQIPCSSGQTITVVEADANYKAQNKGSKTVTVGS